MQEEQVIQEDVAEKQQPEKENKSISKIDKFFKITERGSNWKREIMGGVVTFLAMCYILIVNPNILSQAPGLDGGTMPAGGIFLATALIAGISTIVMGLFAKLPFGLAPGMGTNAFFTFTVCMGMGYKWEEALAAGLIAGVLFLIISLTKIRTIIMEAIPANLRLAIGAGIGLFIAFIGLQGIHVVVDNSATLVGLTTFNGAHAAIAIIGLFGIFLAFILHSLKFKYTIIVTMLVTAVIGIITYYSMGGANAKVLADGPINSGLPSFGEFNYSGLSGFKQTASGFVRGFGSKGLWRWDLILVIITFTFVDMFDTMGTFLATAGPAGLIKEDGSMENMDRALLVDSGGTVVGNMLGTPVVTTYVESSTGISAGARTGLASVVTGLLFLVSIALFPIFQIFSSSAVTAPALVLVGVLMMTQLKNIEWNKPEIAITTFITVIMMVLTYSIANGIAFGIVAYVLTHLVTKKRKDVHWMMYVLAVIFVVYYILQAVF